MKIQYVLIVAFLAWSPAILEVNANDDRVETLTLTRKRDAPPPLPAAAILNVNKDHPRRQEVKLSEEEEIFWEYWQNSMSFSYDAPSAAPTKSVLLTKAPTTKAPSKSPTKAPSKSPTKAPSKSPTKAPTMAPVTSSGPCKDSGTKFVLSNDTGAEKKLKGCKWVGRNNKTEKRCGSQGVASHCPNTCGACAAYSCADSEKGFVKWRKNKKTFTCEWVKKNASAITKRCNMPGIAATCRETCKYIGNGLSC